MLAETEGFLDAMLPRQEAAMRGFCGGDVEPWDAMWSTRGPVSLFGADGSAAERDEVGAVLRRVGSHFGGLVDMRFDLVAAGASGDLAYTVGLEHKTVVFDGEPATYTLRVTHVYRREDGEWRMVHRHGDHPPADGNLAQVVAQTRSAAR